jgi:hypothetical protein
MSPDSRSSRKRAAKKRQAPEPARTRPSADDPHEIVYFKRHRDDDPNESTPGRDFLSRCPTGVRAKFRAVLTQVAAAPPKRFAGGGMWEAMKGDMTGWFEVRRDGPKRHHYRLFCLLDYDADGEDKPLLVVVTGLDKPFKTTIADRDYEAVRQLGDEYRARNPRSIA